jgi:hypothetical protein
MSELLLSVNLETMSTATTKSHGLTEVKVVASILLLPSHPSHSASSIIMKEDCVVELTDKDWAIHPNTLCTSRLQAHKIKQPHLLQGINHKAVLSGLVHGELFLVDGLGLHNDTIPHELWAVVEIIPYIQPSVGPEFPISSVVGSLLETIGILLSESSPISNVYGTNVVCWHFLYKVIIWNCTFAFPFLPY